MEAIAGFYRNAIKRRVNERSPISYRDIVEKASDAVAVERRAFLRGFGEVTTLDGLATSSTTVTQAAIQNAPGATPMEINAVEQNSVPSRPPQLCWCCNSDKHLKRDCPYLFKGQGRGNNATRSTNSVIYRAGYSSRGNNIGGYRGRNEQRRRDEPRYNVNRAGGVHSVEEPVPAVQTEEPQMKQATGPGLVTKPSDEVTCIGPMTDF